MEFRERIPINAAPKQVWDVLWDVTRLAACIPGCQEVRPTEDERRYVAVVTERVGPFQVRFDLDLEITDVQEMERVTVVAQGSDARLGSRMKVEIDVGLETDGEGSTELDVAGDVTVYGKLGSLGYPIIRRKGQEIMSRFAESIKRTVESQEESA